jgi:hypothetical protein
MGGLGESAFPYSKVLVELKKMYMKGAIPWLMYLLE